MLTRIRIEVSEEDSVAAVTDALDQWSALITEKALRPTNGEVNATITDEVIERVNDSHQGRRVIRFTRPPRKCGRITPDKLRGEQAEPGRVSGVTITNEGGGKFSQSGLLPSGGSVRHGSAGKLWRA